jgi:hypothetical protein
MAERRPKPRKPETETESKEKTATQSKTVDLSPEELKFISGGCGGTHPCVVADPSNLDCRDQAP